MDLVGIDRRAVERVGRVLKKHSINLPRLDLYDQRFYPPATADEESVARYFVVMVSMDHRLSRPGKPYEACLEDGCYHGADLLYRLGKLKFDEDPSFFDPGRLAEIKVEDVVKWLSVGGATPPDPEVRAMLLRDLGFKLTRLWDGLVTKLIRSAGGRLRGSLGEQGFVDYMRVFKAFEDPVEKKTMLLAKFLAGRGLFNPVDELDVAVDNHLTRQAVRTGLVVVSGELWDKIKQGVEISRDEDVLLRLTVKLAYRHLSSTAGIRASTLDDFFWLHGRTVCLRDKPECEKCILRNVCTAFRNKSFMVNEPTYYNTWYY
ncbi:iron-sulfur cluster loop containing protein [Thermogladius calderae 1633]|uniref:Iron-sulfur cluster loop containing protein n=1 Tax=Thermogladius calderae (strain DSM 22663 / VKM B-2946 / 1633) TaxID=1184251 RepID=I3TE98_THEC1|nr:iron-sulfur cluster loop containing protein [Thermogladius calderae]AFK51086.1 iron-sulfur cluster loop containing protein [Thermogladius calderae 1633]